MNMIKNIRDIPEKFLLFYDCNSPAEAAYVKKLVASTNEPGNRLYNIDAASFFNETGYGIFNEEVRANNGSVYADRYSYDGSATGSDYWSMTCAGHTILVFSNSGDLIVDLYEKIGHDTRDARDNRDIYLYAKIIVDAVKDYREGLTFDNNILDLDDIIL